MLYTSHLLDRKTGELVLIESGDWITITELGELYSVGPRRVRTILRHMGFLQVEGGGRQHRHRLRPWVTDRGWGRRIQAKGTIPFDVIGPDAREWIDERWKATVEAIAAEQSSPLQMAKADLDCFRETRNSFRRSLGRPEMDIAEMVSWLGHFHPGLSHSDIASILDVSQQLVSRYLAERERERKRWEAFKREPLGDKPRSISGSRMDQL